jgi:hypothetical protein
MGVSRAATSLGQLLSKKVLLSVPSVEIISREDAAGFVEQSNSPTLVAVQQLFEGSLSGKALTDVGQILPKPGHRRWSLPDFSEPRLGRAKSARNPETVIGSFDSVARRRSTRRAGSPFKIF